MSFLRKKSFIISVLILLMTVTAAVLASDYIPSNRDTKKDPEQMVFDIKEPSDYTLLYETKDFKYFFREDRNVIAIYDKRNGYTWKTGLDIPFNKDIVDSNDKALAEGKTPDYLPQEVKLNTIYTGIANSLVTVEYYDNSNNIKRVSSGSYDGVKSKMNKIADNHYRLDIKFNTIDISMKLHIYFDEKGISYEIKDEEIEGKGTKVLASVMITPFLGANGGQKSYWNEEEQQYNIIKSNEMKPGYIFVPDGPGALIRFKDNATLFKEYVGEVYGTNYSQNEYFNTRNSNFIPLKNPKLPVFGVAYGEQQNAFCAYAVDGAEHMEIVVMPEENMTNYNWVYPRFVYNKLFYQVYNKKNDGYFTLLEERNHFDIKIRYDFLEGKGEDGTPSADYVGMARNYREYLINNGLLKAKLDDINIRVPIRIDFIMADAKRNIMGFEDVVVTTIDNVKDILTSLYNEGVTNINSGLYGWQKGGVTLGKPWKTEWNSDIGKAKDFKDTILSMQELGIDISLAQDYTYINSEQMNIRSNAAKHVNGRYNELYIGRDFPIHDFNYARPSKSASWLKKQTNLFNKLGVNSLTIEGITNILIGDYSKQKLTSEQTMDLYKSTLEELDKTNKISALAPNSYLWKYIDRFLSAPVFSSQFIIETDNVPFIQLVLAGSMEVYAPYSNFSFYNDKDILRMIDYNVYPSFVITEESAHHLSYTNSANFYTTEFSLYKDLIKKIYDEVNNALVNVLGSEWIDRQVLEDGVIVNRYDNGVEIVINYTDNVFNYQNTKIEPLSYKVIK